MKLLLKTIYVALLAVMITGCYKDNEDNVTEKALTIAVNPDPGSTIARTLGTTYDFQVAVTSPMPPRGVDVTVEYRLDSDNSIVFSQNYSMTTSPLPVLISNIPFNEVGTVTVTAVSKTKRTNTASQFFKLVRK